MSICDNCIYRNLYSQPSCCPHEDECYGDWDEDEDEDEEDD